MLSSSLLERAQDLASRESGLAVVVTYRIDGTAQASVVNAGVIRHPLSGEPAAGFVVQGGDRKKLANVRARPLAIVVFRSGWDWVAIQGDVDLVGLDNQSCMPIDAARRLFHKIYATAIGGTPDDWAAGDDVIGREGHTAVLVRPTRVYSNPSRNPALGLDDRLRKAASCRIAC